MTYAFKPEDVVISVFPDNSHKHGMLTGKIPVGIKVIHIPTGIVVTCETERSQHKNRELALNKLWELVKDKPTYNELLVKIETLQNGVLAQRIVELTNNQDALAAQVKQLVSDIHNAAIGYLTMGHSVDIESMAQCAYELTGINAEGCHTVNQHNDEIAVDRFGSAMKTKLKAARAKGRSGWDDKTSCSGGHLAQLLIEHLAKGNAGTFEDIANFSMMLHQRGEDPQLLRTALILRDAEIKAQAVEQVFKHFKNKFNGSEKLTVRDICWMLDEHLKQIRQQAKESK